jgi:Xaa-Pro aminopeptidase
MSSRLEKLREVLASKNVDAVLVSDEKNIFYFTEFLGGFKLLVPSDGECTLFVHSVNYEAAREQARNVRVEPIKIGEKADAKIFEEISRCSVKTLGFDRVSAVEYLKIGERLKDVRMEFLDDAIWSLRKVKDENELKFMRKAAELTSKGMEKAIEIVRAGLKEYEIAAEIEFEMRKLGSNGIAFDTIICSGPDSAFPHGRWGEREIRSGDLVVIDIGAKYRGYCSDQTRTLIVGTPSEKQIHVYRAVAEAQEAAISRIKSGEKASEIDAAARRRIVEKGYGEYFVHSLGHGVGLDIHEPPSLGPSSGDILSSRNVVTVEPGIYIPGFGGVRLEDTVLVHEEGAIKLTDAPILQL